MDAMPSATFLREAIEPYSWFDPEILRKYEQYAQPVHLGESGRQTINARLIPAGQ